MGRKRHYARFRFAASRRKAYFRAVRRARKHDAILV